MARTLLSEAQSLCSELPEGTAVPVAASQAGTLGHWHIPEQIPDWDSRAVSYISMCRAVSTWTHVLELHVPLQGFIIFLLPHLLVSIQRWLLSSRVALCRRKTCSFSAAYGCISPSMQAVVQGQCGASGEKRDICGAFFLRRWASVSVKISKFLTSMSVKFWVFFRRVRFRISGSEANVSGF